VGGEMRERTGYGVVWPGRVVIQVTKAI